MSYPESMPRPDLSSMFTGLFGLIGQGVPERLWAEVQPWLGDLTRNAAAKWGLHVLEGLSCARCRRLSVGACDGCGKPTCLHHGRIGKGADILCEPCAKRFAKKSKASPERPPPPPPPPGRLEALRTLGLPPFAEWAEIQARFREMARYHPDRFTGPKKAQAEAVFKEWSAAYQVLREAR